jgi:hypothetical protein
MDITHYYAIVFSVFILAILIQPRLPHKLQPPHSFKVFRNVRSKFPIGSTSTTWTAILAALLYLTANIICAAVRCADWVDFVHRCGILSIINAIPLFLGERPAVLPQFIRPSVATCDISHRWTGSVTLVEAGIHAIGRLVIQRATGLRGQANITGLIVSVSGAASFDGCR